MKKRIDKKLIEAFKKGDLDAFNEIFEVYSKNIYYSIFSQCKNEEITNEVVQETFVNVYQSIQTLRNDEAFHSWIFKIAYNNLKRILKKESKYVQESDEQYNPSNFEDVNALPMYKEIENAEFLSTLHKSIQELPPKMRAVAQLKYYEGFSQKEISQILNISEGTVKSRSFKLSRLLKSKLSSQGIEPKTFHAKGFVFPIAFINVLSGINHHMVSYSEVVEATQSTQGKIAIASGIVSLKAMLTAGICTATVVSLGTFYVLNRDDAKEVISVQPVAVEQKKKDTAKIENIEFSTNYTNQPIEVSISLTNDEYDSVRIDGIEGFSIHENGTYTAQVLKDGNVVDARTFEINSIDSQSPDIVSSSLINGTCIVVMSDDFSGVDFNTIRFYRNGVQAYDFYAYPDRMSIEFPFVSQSSNILYVQDNAGNLREVSIVSNQHQ